MRPFEPKVTHGNGDIISCLEEAITAAKSGELVGVIVIGITGQACGWTGAYNDGIDFPWPRLQAAVDTAQQELVTKGVEAWE